ncbi:MAG: ParA family protein, partial [Limnothrix sp.]
MSKSKLQEALLSLSPGENEPEIARKLICHAVLPTLGFAADEMTLEYMTGWGSKKVDIAARKNTSKNNFSIDRKDPSLIVELKKRDLDLSSTSKVYANAVKQLKGYLSPASKCCQSATWGLLTNANRIQLFRRHGKVIYPFTTNIELTINNIDDKITLIRQYLDNEKKALSVAIYNNKGGVGKTTTVINLAGILSLPLGKKGAPLGFNKKVLVVDFDPNQQDLTDLLQVTPGKLPFSSFLDDYKNQNVQDVISRYV